jgi:hypothetical protein
VSCTGSASLGEACAPVRVQLVSLGAAGRPSRLSQLSLLTACNAVGVSAGADAIAPTVPSTSSPLLLARAVPPAWASLGDLACSYGGVNYTMGVVVPPADSNYFLAARLPAMPWCAAECLRGIHVVWFSMCLLPVVYFWFA